jgi:hypothetical protein
MESAGYREGIASAYKGEWIGENLYRELANRSIVEHQKAKLHAIADVEQYTFRRLKPIADRLGIDVAAGEWKRVVERRATELYSVGWPDFIDKALRDWPPFIVRFEALLPLAPPPDTDAVRCLIDHEVALVEFARIEHNAVGSEAALLRLEAFLHQAERIVSARG